MPPRILIADADEAFGLMLKQMLEINGDYAVEHVTSGAVALSTVQQTHPDLVILDLTIGDVQPAALIKAVQRVAPEVRIMLIPLGEQLPEDVKGLSVQGILTKPFFIGDLGAQIAAALGTEVKQLVNLPPPPEKKAPPPAKPRVRQIIQPPSSRPSEIQSEAPPSAATSPAQPGPRVRQAVPSSRAVVSPSEASQAGAQLSQQEVSQRLDKILTGLTNELRADGLFVFQHRTLVTQRSTFTTQRVENFAALVQSWSQIAHEMAAFIGETNEYFQQLHFEGERYHVYAFAIPSDIALVIVARTDIPFGILRLNIKSASREISQVLR